MTLFHSQRLIMAKLKKVQKVDTNDKPSRHQTGPTNHPTVYKNFTTY